MGDSPHMVYVSYNAHEPTEPPTASWTPPAETTTPEAEDNPKDETFHPFTLALEFEQFLRTVSQGNSSKIRNAQRTLAKTIEEFYSYLDTATLLTEETPSRVDPRLLGNTVDTTARVMAQMCHDARSVN